MSSRMKEHYTGKQFIIVEPADVSCSWACAYWGLLQHLCFMTSMTMGANPMPYWQCSTMPDEHASCSESVQAADTHGAADPAVSTAPPTVPVLVVPDLPMKEHVSSDRDATLEAEFFWTRPSTGQKRATKPSFSSAIAPLPWTNFHVLADLSEDAGCTAMQSAGKPALSMTTGQAPAAQSQTSQDDDFEAALAEHHALVVCAWADVADDEESADDAPTERLPASPDFGGDSDEANSFAQPDVVIPDAASSSMSKHRAAVEGYANLPERGDVSSLDGHSLRSNSPHHREAPAAGVFPPLDGSSQVASDDGSLVDDRECLLDVPMQAKLDDPLWYRRVRRTHDGVTFVGTIREIWLSADQAERIYEVCYDDGTLEHLDEMHVLQSLVRHPRDHECLDLAQPMS
jgi:hypothetical protein